MVRIRGLFWQGVILFFWALIPFSLLNFGPVFLGLSALWAFAVTLGYLCALITVFLWWLSRDEKILGEVNDPILGVVIRRRSGWRGTFDIPSTGEHEDEYSIEISGGDALDPTAIQLSTFVEIEDGWGKWIAELTQALCRDQSASVCASEILYDGIKISADEWEWQLNFWIERDGEDLDFVAIFKDGALAELCSKSDF